MSTQIQSSSAEILRGFVTEAQDHPMVPDARTFLTILNPRVMGALVDCVMAEGHNEDRLPPYSPRGSFLATVRSTRFLVPNTDFVVRSLRLRERRWTRIEEVRLHVFGEGEEPGFFGIDATSGRRHISRGPEALDEIPPENLSFMLGVTRRLVDRFTKVIV